MTSLLHIVRRIVEEELARKRGVSLAVVSAVTAHEKADDSSNYEASVKLKHEGLELHGVPIAAPHVGAAGLPKEGDLVLLSFVEGSLDQPIIVGRLYDGDQRAPLHKEGEILIEHRVPDNTLNQLRFASDGTIFLQRDVQKPEDNSKAKTGIKIDGASGDIEIRVGDNVKVEIKGDKVSITADVEINGKLTVSNGAHKTTIDGNAIEGA